MNLFKKVFDDYMKFEARTGKKGIVYIKSDLVGKLHEDEKEYFKANPPQAFYGIAISSVDDLEEDYVIDTDKKLMRAFQRICQCKTVEDRKIAYMGTVKLQNHELESLDEFYCFSCNSFWREP